MTVVYAVVAFLAGFGARPLCRWLRYGSAVDREWCRGCGVELRPTDMCRPCEDGIDRTIQRRNYR